ncbi:MAG: hypothetical protein H7Y62_05035, partial [Hyphomicrobium sp.]|nr:hypothetical protein [Hyphomicrobium sp.]
MRKLIFVPAIALLFVLPGCVRTPEFREDVLTTTDVVLNIKCELRNALRKMRPHSGWLTTPDKSWAAGFTVTMNVVARSDLGAEAGFVIPLTPGIFSVALTAGGMTQATRTETFDFTENLGELLAFDRCPQDIVNDHHILLEGRLGFEDILGRVLASRDVAKLQLTSLAYNLDFDIEKGGSVGPSDPYRRQQYLWWWNNAGWQTHQQQHIARGVFAAGIEYLPLPRGAQRIQGLSAAGHGGRGRQEQPPRPLRQTWCRSRRRHRA